MLKEYLYRDRIKFTGDQNGQFIKEYKKRLQWIYDHAEPGVYCLTACYCQKNVFSSPDLKKSSGSIRT